MKVDRFLLFLLLISLSLAGCGAKSEADLGTSAELDDVPSMDAEARRSYLDSFPLLNEEMLPSAPRDPYTGRAPFGVLLKLPSVGKVGACSAAHVSRGILVTNSHCVAGALRAGVAGFHFVYYGKENTKRHGSIDSFVYLGSGQRDDVALMKIDPLSAAQWDTMDSAIAKRGELAGRKPALAESVIVWGFDPVNHRGMRFAPRSCLASRTQPRLVGMAGSDRTPIQVSQTDEKIHFFLDECDRPLRHGNSGSVITSSDGYRRMWGVYHWAVGPTQAALDRFTAFEYTGNRNEPRIVQGSPTNGEFFGVGSAFENLPDLVRLLPYAWDRSGRKYLGRRRN